MGRIFYAEYDPYLQWNEDLAKRVGEGGYPSDDCPDSGISDVSSKNAHAVLPWEPSKLPRRKKIAAGCAR